jgi:hypothetical protein
MLSRLTRLMSLKASAKHMIGEAIHPGALPLVPDMPRARRAARDAAGPMIGAMPMEFMRV